MSRCSTRCTGRADKLLEQPPRWSRPRATSCCLTSSGSPSNRSWPQREMATTTPRSRSSSSRAGPGTGKSVIAVNLVAELASAASTPSTSPARRRSPRTCARSSAAAPARLVQVLPRSATSDRNDVDVVILDEAHRIRTISTSRFTPAKARTGKAQIDDILDASRVTVFFIDDLQVVRPGEVGSTDLIREAAAKRWRSRSASSSSRRSSARTAPTRSSSGSTTRSSSTETPQVLWPTDDDVRLPDRRLGRAARRADPRRRQGRGRTARLVAGFCWPWSDPDDAGQLVPDVRVGDWSMPWNAKDGVGRLGARHPEVRLLGERERGDRPGRLRLHRAGLRVRLRRRHLRPRPRLPADGWGMGRPARPVARPRRPPRRHRAEFTDFVKSTYRVLLTRGLRGCYVYLEDATTRRQVNSTTRRTHRWLAGNSRPRYRRVSINPSARHPGVSAVLLMIDEPP